MPRSSGVTPRTAEAAHSVPRCPRALLQKCAKNHLKQAVALHRYNSRRLRSKLQMLSLQGLRKISGQASQSRVPFELGRLPINREPRIPSRFGPLMAPTKLWRERHQDVRRVRETGSDVHVRIAYTHVDSEAVENRGHGVERPVQRSKIVCPPPQSALKGLNFVRRRVPLQDEHRALRRREDFSKHPGVDLLE